MNFSNWRTGECGGLLTHDDNHLVIPDHQERHPLLIDDELIDKTT